MEATMKTSLKTSAAAAIGSSNDDKDDIANNENEHQNDTEAPEGVSWSSEQKMHCLFLYNLLQYTAAN